VCMYVCMHVRVCVYVCVHACARCVYVCVHACARVSVPVGAWTTEVLPTTQLSGFSFVVLPLPSCPIRLNMALPVSQPGLSDWLCQPHTQLISQCIRRHEGERCDFRSGFGLGDSGRLGKEGACLCVYYPRNILLLLRCDRILFARRLVSLL